MKILDSNIWIAFFNERDSQHEKAQKLMKSVKTPIAMPEYVIVETCNILLAKASKEDADSFLNFALDNEEVVLLLSNGNLFFETVSYFQKTTKRILSFVDISLLCLSKSYEIATFDRKLEKELKRKSPLKEFFELRKKISTKMTTKDIIKSVHKGKLSYDPKKRKTF
jgi:predicted nucleic acid-binding protein